MDKDTIHSTINKLVDIIDEEKFLNIINDATIDRYVKKLTAYRFFLMCIVAQIKSEASLGSLSGYQENNPDFQSLVGFKSISKSQLFRKQNDLPSERFDHDVDELQPISLDEGSERPRPVSGSISVSW